MTHFPLLGEDLVRRYDVAAPRYTSYPTAPVWSERFGETEYVAALERASSSDAPLSIYVHIPFCRKMCSYCGCNVIVSKDGSKIDPYLRAVDREASLVASHLGSRTRMSRLHLGGGTPTTLDERQLVALWRTITDHFTPDRDAELALEIDPMVTRKEQLALLRGMGFNRLSMGVQDFDADVQKAVNRIQTVDDTRRILDYARAIGFASVNFDLIYGLPMQTPSSWARTIDEICVLRPDRISLFSFAYVPDVKPHQRRLPSAHIPHGPAKLALFRLAHDQLVDAGYRAIGMDHFALPEDELARARDDGRLWRDFQGYTVTRAPETIALGVSAIGQVGGAFVQNTRLLPRYQAWLADGHLPVERGHALSDDDRERSAIITQLMCNQRVDLAPGAYGDELARLAPLEADGLVVREGSRITATDAGRVLIRNIASIFDAYLPRDANAARPVFSRTV
ncbi:MAG TPA: oxygen-independent coproporphyrinogen III oxidase [Kofleriaceae bacterium]|nr:oxygen-independent coproporphyrinogen III oxidase [Kofleriaceae bacterium]